MLIVHHSIHANWCLEVGLLLVQMSIVIDVFIVIDKREGVCRQR